EAVRKTTEDEGAGEPALCVTPESLRASLKEDDIVAALGRAAPPKKSILKRKDVPKGQGKRELTAFSYIREKTLVTLIVFIGAVLFHTAFANTGIWPGSALPEDLRVLIAAFFWALSGSYVWILIQFRRFGAANAFEPSHARVFQARTYSGAVVTSVLLYFVFGGAEPWATKWEYNLPLWAFVFGYAARLQVKFLHLMVQRIEDSIVALFATRFPSKAKRQASNEERAKGGIGEPTPPSEQPAEALEKGPGGKQPDVPTDKDKDKDADA
ncbi:MAG: hypothetical protein GY849_03030, partial [Deltaproteobacteria bacterium]|nr:hypothetical protein [Deltaproteobacteria bacterium]